MENASKALLIGAEILIGLAIMTIFVVIINQFGGFARNVNEQISEKEINLFNANFYVVENRFDISAQEIASIINFAKKENDKNNLDIRKDEDRNSIYFIHVFINDKDYFIDLLKDNEYEAYRDQNKFVRSMNNFLRDYNKYYFACKVKVEAKTNPYVTGENKKTIKIKGYNNSDVKVETRTRLVKEIRFTLVEDNVRDDTTGFMVNNYRVDTKDEYKVIEN